MTTRAWIPALLLGGCAGLPDADPEALAEILARLPPPPGPYVRVRAEVDLETPGLAGTFQAVLLARTGSRPAVRLQLLPDLGGKVLDLAVRPDRVRGWFPASGERFDAALPEEARPHLVVFIGLTLLERFAGLEGRITGAERRGEDWFFEVRPVVAGLGVSGRVGPGDPPAPSELRFRWSAFVGWALSGPPDEVRAPGFRLRIRVLDRRVLERIDESLLDLELPPEPR